MSGSLIERAAEYAVRSRGANRPARVTELALMNLTDWFAVTLGAADAPAGRKVAEVVRGWGMHGPAALMTGGQSAPMGAALVNGTLAHCLDYDDLHFPSLAHLSAPTWAAVLAVAGKTQASESRMVDAFLAGFEISARLGDNGVGKAVTDRGWHSTGVHGRLSAAIAAAVLMDLDVTGVAHAMAIAATQTSGLTTSFGTMSKPFHAGKAAADGVLAAELAAAGFEGATQILDAERSLVSALVQDGSVQMRLDGLGEHWEIERNALKPYACCGLTHAPLDCARALAIDIAGREVTRTSVETHPLAGKVANQVNPQTGLAGKFSLAYCVALGLAGFRATEADFSDSRLSDRRVRDIEQTIALHAVDDLEPQAARMQVELADGSQLRHAVEVSLGNPENPMGWDDLKLKFQPLAQTASVREPDALFDALRAFEQPGALDRVWSLAVH
ncbi:MAG: MmgE/PrpD family protein [Pseudomonadota bacterium]